uniref:Uncharacterized protein n=1 Tax=Angiostrongylus cantonensis TaxID=6313 RepID=A0A0K0DAD6_ANGCA
MSYGFLLKRTAKGYLLRNSQKISLARLCNCSQYSAGTNYDEYHLQVRRFITATTKPKTLTFTSPALIAILLDLTTDLLQHVQWEHTMIDAAVGGCVRNDDCEQLTGRN